MILPSEIRKVSFKKSGVLTSGYDTEEVRAFLSSLSIEWEDVLTTQEQLKSDLEIAHKQILKLKERELALTQALQKAEESSFSAKDKIEQDAMSLIKKAEKKAHDMIDKADQSKIELEKEIGLLIARKNDIVQQIKNFLNLNLEKLSTFEQEFKPERIQSTIVQQSSFFDTFLPTKPLPALLTTLFQEKL